MCIYITSTEYTKALHTYFYMLKYTININVICQDANYIYYLDAILSNRTMSIYSFYSSQKYY